MARKPTPPAEPAPKRPAHRPLIDPALRAVTISLRARPEDRDNLALARHLFAARTDSDAWRKALAWAVLDAGKRLTAKQRAAIIQAPVES